GSCAMVVNGRPRWTCRTRVSEVAEGDRLKLEPLRNLTIVKDLAVEMTDFFVVPPETRERQTANAGIECIGCGVCYSACDVVAWDQDYLGPAALNRAWTLVNDVRDRGQTERIDAVATDAGCHACHTHMSCTQFCPKQIAPTYAIAGLKRAVMKRAFGGGG